MKPQELRFSKTHEWVHIQAEPARSKLATVGISAYAVEALTDLVYIQLPDLGRTVKAGEPLGEVESVKAVSDIYSPVSGEVIAVNDKLAASLDVLGSDPYGEGWIAKIQLAGDEGLGELLDYAAYQQLCAEEHG